MFGKIIISHDKINTATFYLGSLHKRVINTSIVGNLAPTTIRDQKQYGKKWGGTSDIH